MGTAACLKDSHVYIWTVCLMQMSHCGWSSMKDDSDWMWQVHHVLDLEWTASWKLLQSPSLIKALQPSSVHLAHAQYVSIQSYAYNRSSSTWFNAITDCATFYYLNKRRICGMNTVFTGSWSERKAWMTGCDNGCFLYIVLLSQQDVV